MKTNPKRLIKVSLPLKAISALMERRGILLMDLSVKESVLQFNPQGKVDVEE
jgi:hypothetical protein